jgi:hypothetical protein
MIEQHPVVEQAIAAIKLELFRVRQDSPNMPERRRRRSRVAGACLRSRPRCSCLTPSGPGSRRKR